MSHHHNPNQHHLQGLPVPYFMGGPFGGPPRQAMIGPQGHPSFMNPQHVHPIGPSQGLPPPPSMHFHQRPQGVIGPMMPPSIQQQHHLQQTSVPNPNFFSPGPFNSMPHQMFSHPQNFHPQHSVVPQPLLLPQQPAPPPQVAPVAIPSPPSVPQGDVPYFDLPAGLMVPLVKLEDWQYKAIDPKEVKLPIPIPPSERLLKAVDAFYAPPSHDRPRDSQGWEKLALYEYYKVKEESTKGKAGTYANEVLECPSKADTRTSEQEQETKSPNPPQRIFREETSPHRESPRDLSSSSSSSSSRSPSPVRKNKRAKRKGSYRRSRSPSPGSYKPSFSSISKDPPPKLQETNKGHQLLKKMGWTGTGLGLSNQGIQEPLSSGEVRDQASKFKGIGAEADTTDLYETYRRSRGQAFMDRIVKGKDE